MRPHRGLFSWTFAKTNDMYQRIDQYARKFSHIGLFNFIVAADGSVSGSVWPGEDLLRQRHPEIEWYLTVRNDGYTSIFRAIATSARAKFLAEIGRLLDTYPWVAGIDLDLERGPNEARSQVTDLYRAVAAVVHARGKKLHADLPPKQGDHLPWWEEWCDYQALASVLDTALIMTYGYAWAGSSVGPITLRSWLEDTYDYAATRFRPDQLFMGLPAYGFRWELYKDPSTLPDRSYRGVGSGYLPFLDWMQGTNTHTDGLHDGQPATETQPHIAWAGIWDEENWQTRALLHVYDLLDGRDFQLLSPAVRGMWLGRYYATATTKWRDTQFTGQVVNRLGDSYDSLTGAVIVEPNEHWIAPIHPRVWQRTNEYVATGDGGWYTDPNTGQQVWTGNRVFQLDFAPVIPGTLTVYLNGSPAGGWTCDWQTGILTFDQAPAAGVAITASYQYTEPDGRAIFNLSLPAGGPYQIAVEVNFTWFDRRTLVLDIDGQQVTVGGPGVVEQWYPLFRVPHWIVLPFTLTAGNHILTLLGCDMGSDPGVQLRAIAVAASVTQTVTAGGVQATLQAQPFVDRDGNLAYPYQNRFEIALEWLRRPPDPAPVWGTRWTEYPQGDFSQPGYRVTGEWQISTWTAPVVGSGSGNSTGSSSQDSGAAVDTVQALAGAGSVELDYDGFTDLVVTANLVAGAATTAIGIYFGSVRLVVYAGGQVVLEQGGAMIASAATAWAPNVSRTLKLRARNGLADAWIDGDHVLGPVAVAAAPGTAGFLVNGGSGFCTAFLVGDAHWYMPMEAAQIVLPDGSLQEVGRVARAGVTWNEWGYFRLQNEALEEIDTRSYRFSTDWDYTNTGVFQIAPGAYPVTIWFEDPGVWLSKLYLGDADGFSEAYWADWETHRRYADLAHYKYGLLGTGFWAVGMEDPKLLPHLLDQ